MITETQLLTLVTNIANIALSEIIAAGLAKAKDEQFIHLLYKDFVRSLIKGYEQLENSEGENLLVFTKQFLNNGYST